MLASVVDGNKVLHSPPEDRLEDRGVIILLDGLGGTKESLKTQTKAFTREGHAVVLADHYNEGQRRCEALSNREGWKISQKTYFWTAIWKTALEVPRLIDFAIEKFGTANIAAYGQSMGGDIFLTSLVFERRLKAVVTEVSTPNWLRPNSINNNLGSDENGDRLYHEKCPWNNLEAFAAHPSAMLLINGDKDLHVPGACSAEFVKNLRARGYYAQEERLQHLILPSCGSQGHAIVEEASYRACDFITDMFSQPIQPQSPWESYTAMEGGDAWAVWELLKGHCKLEESWEDAKTEAGKGDTVYEGEEDDFDDDDFVWELLREDWESVDESFKQHGGREGRV